MSLQFDTTQSVAPDVVCETDAVGNVVRCFSAPRIGSLYALAMAPPVAAQQGFHPGHLYIAHGDTPIRGLNNGVVTELSQNGEHIRSFCGGKTSHTSLGCPTDMIFAPDGRLLVATGKSVVAFEDGGGRARRFALGLYGQLTSDASHRIWGVRQGGANHIVKIFDVRGHLLGTLGGVFPPDAYSGIAYSSQGHVFVHKCRLEESAVEIYDPAGELIHSFAAPPYCSQSRVAIDAENRLYFCCQRTQEIFVVSAEGVPIRRIILQGNLTPKRIFIQNNGNLWVCGSTASYP
jgi:hypothetical protein